MTFNPQMSKVYAAATVFGAEAMAECIKAYERNGTDRLECLHSAKENLVEWMQDIDAAIAAEVPKVAA